MTPPETVGRAQRRLDPECASHVTQPRGVFQRQRPLERDQNAIREPGLPAEAAIAVIATKHKLLDARGLLAGINISLDEDAPRRSFARFQGVDLAWDVGIGLEIGIAQPLVAGGEFGQVVISEVRGAGGKESDAQRDTDDSDFCTGQLCWIAANAGDGGQAGGQPQTGMAVSDQLRNVAADRTPRTQLVTASTLSAGTGCNPGPGSRASVVRRRRSSSQLQFRKRAEGGIRDKAPGAAAGLFLVAAGCLLPRPRRAVRSWPARTARPRGGAKPAPGKAR